MNLKESKPVQRSFIALFATVIVAVCGSGGPLRAASIRFLPLNEELAGREIGVRDSKGVTKLKDLNAQKRSKAYPCVTGKTPLLLVAQDREGPDGKPAAVEIALSPDLKSPLVLILPDPAHASGFRALALEDHGDGFPWGSFRFVNATDLALAIGYENEVKPLPGSLVAVDVKLAGEARNIGVKLSKEGDPQAVLYSAVWEFDPNVRNLIFVVPGPDPETAEVDLKIIPDDRRVKK